MKTIQRLILSLCVLGVAACGGEREEPQEPYQGPTLPFQSKDVLGWRYDQISKDHTFSVRFADGGYAPAIRVSDGTVSALLYKWRLDESDCLVLSNHDGVVGAYQLVSLSPDKVTVWDKVKHQTMEFTRLDTKL